MSFDWLLSPATQYCALALGLAACLLLFLSGKMDVQAIRQEARNSSESLDASITSLSAEVQGIRLGVRELDTTPAVMEPAAEGLNLTKRAQAVRMHRRGEPVPTIAAALRTPQNEVELLLKIQRLMNSQNS